MPGRSPYRVGANGGASVLLATAVAGGVTGARGALKAGVVGVCGDGRAVLVVEGLGRRPPLAHRCDDDVVLHSIPKVHSSSQAYRNSQWYPGVLRDEQGSL